MTNRRVRQVLPLLTIRERRSPRVLSVREINSLRNSRANFSSRRAKRFADIYTERVSVGSVIKFKTQFAKLDCITWNNLDKFVTWKRSIGKKSFSPIGNVELTKVEKKEKKRKEKHPRSCRKGEIKERNERKEEKLISRIIRFKV